MRADGLLPTYQHPSARVVNTTWVEGFIAAIDSVRYLYAVTLDNGTEIRDVRRVASSPSDAALLPLGARVLVCSAPPLGPYICGVVSYPPKRDVTILPHLSSSARRIQPGDNINYGVAGNFVGALSTGSCVMQSEPMAHVSTHADGHVDIHSRTYSHRSLFGETLLTRKGTTVNYSIRGGASITDDTSPLLDDAWTFRADVGADANMLHVRVTTPRNQVLGEFYMGSDGSMRMGAQGGRLSQVAGADTRFVDGDDFSEVRDNSQLVVKKDRRESFGSYAMTSQGEASYTHLGGSTKTVLGNETKVISGRKVSKVGGDTSTHADGGMETVIAAPYAGVIPNPLALQSATWVNYAGSYNFSVQMPGQAFNVYTTGPASVNLGVPLPAIYNPLTGTHTVPPPVALFTPVLMEKLSLWMSSLLTALSLHEHPVAGVIAGPSVSLSAATTTLGSSLPTLGSAIVRLGG